MIAAISMLASSAAYTTIKLSILCVQRHLLVSNLHLREFHLILVVLGMGRNWTLCAPLRLRGAGAIG